MISENRAVLGGETQAMERRIRTGDEEPKIGLRLGLRQPLETCKLYTSIALSNADNSVQCMKSIRPRVGAIGRELNLGRVDSIEGLDLLYTR